MYDPSLGRWLSEDPIEIEGGDPNLYRYVRNNPTNATDPTGLSERVVLAEVDGPASANATDLFPDLYPAALPDAPTLGPGIIRQTPKVVYTQVQGYYLDIGAGVWGQPRSSADGSGEGLQSGDEGITMTGVTSKYGGARSIVTIKGERGPQQIRYCNTVIAESNESNNGGELEASFKHFRPGKYKVKVRIEIKLAQQQGTIGPIATVYAANESGGYQQREMLYTANERGYRLVEDIIQINELTVQVDKNGMGKVAKIVPKVAGQWGSGVVANLLASFGFKILLDRLKSRESSRFSSRTDVCAD